MILQLVSLPVNAGLVSALRRMIFRHRYRFERQPAPGKRQLLVDVSVIIGKDDRTGIQRVVRALLGQLQVLVDSSVVVQPVFASRNHGYCKAKLLEDGRICNAAADPRGRQPVEARSGDVFLGLDLAAHILPHVEADLARWRRGGVAIAVMVYDLLPILRPDWFPPRMSRRFDRWLGVLARQATQCLCISSAVAGDLADELRARQVVALPHIATIPLGSDLADSFPTRGLPSDITDLRAWVQGHRVIMSVGTIEPRKGHQQLVDALSLLWQAQADSDIALLIVGRPGWKTSDLQNRLRHHAEHGRRLIWLDSASDELLAELYRTATGVVAASQGEGFGLPLIEALAHGAPVLARDISVFREIGGSLFDYFDDDRPSALCARVMAWLGSLRPPPPSSVGMMPRWKDSAQCLVRALGLPARESVSA